MGKRKKEDQLFIAVNCTIQSADLELVRLLGKTPDGFINQSLGFRRAFKALRDAYAAVTILEKIKENPENAYTLASQFFKTYQNK